MTKLCIKILVESDSAIESVFPWGNTDPLVASAFPKTWTQKNAAVKFTAAFFYFYFDSARAFSKVFLMLSDGSLSMRLTTMIAMTEKKKPGTSS